MLSNRFVALLATSTQSISPLAFVALRQPSYQLHTSNTNHKSIRKWCQSLWTPLRTDPPYDHVAQIGDPVLRQKASDVPSESITSPEVQFVVDRMTGVLQKYQCVGLAAPQIGVPLNIVILCVTEKMMKSHSSETVKLRQMETIPLTVLINPEMKVTNYLKTSFIESCESVRGYLAEVPRYEEVNVKGYDTAGRLQELKLKGWSARIIQHEMDHLNGIIYTDVMNRKTFSCSCWQAVNSREGRVYINFAPK